MAIDRVRVLGQAPALQENKNEGEELTYRKLDRVSTPPP